eukprot:gnl/TRDRNA2_/TRDRNA2_188905_c0_seq1.p1 gnl/TRDRNA2_/TRDRNA2_188905_c0~~gnl/TRDRNA2_/TRDRNA2_188905_c0_seq1.p1  ORF type:complete len:168 (-),score=35.06 gnl/TRDRNA2_/TRDRNA2_188905_c0_seq1:103-606(-)
MVRQILLLTAVLFITSDASLAWPKSKGSLGDWYRSGSLLQTEAQPAAAPAQHEVKVQHEAKDQHSVASKAPADDEKKPRPALVAANLRQKQAPVTRMGQMSTGGFSAVAIAMLGMLLLSTCMVFMWSQESATPFFGPKSVCCCICCTPFSLCFPFDRNPRGYGYNPN